MLISKNTSRDTTKSFIIKAIFSLIVISGIVVMLGKIDFPSPNKEIEKKIPNEKLKIVK